MSDTPIATKVEYVTWTAPSTEEEGLFVSYTGVLTGESDTEVTLLTKRGEMTILKTDGEFKDATREDFDNSVGYLPEVAPVVAKAPRGKKGPMVAAIIQSFKDLATKDIINHIAAQLNINFKTAQIYYYKYRGDVVSQEPQQQGS